MTLTAPLLTARMHGSIGDYYLAPGGEGPLAAEWNDKPHRLIYDLLGEVQALRSALRSACDVRGGGVQVKFRGRWYMANQLDAVFKEQK
jgi:hypothetical protein